MGAEGTQGRASKQVRSGFPGKGMLALSVEGCCEFNTPEC